MTGNLKQGKPPPKGVRELVLKMAGRNPRPTNREIIDEVKRKFGEAISIDGRTISRYCKDVGLPTSSRKPKAIKKAPASPQLITEIKKLVEEIKRITIVPPPETPSLPTDAESKSAVAAIMQGNSMPFVSIVQACTTPMWWHARISIKVVDYLDAEKLAVFNRFLELTNSKDLNNIIAEWESAAEKYRKIKKLNSNNLKIKEAYLEAKAVKDRLDSELSKAVVALY